jgi:hypothetical protein
MINDISNYIILIISLTILFGTLIFSAYYLVFMPRPQENIYLISFFYSPYKEAIDNNCYYVNNSYFEQLLNNYLSKAIICNYEVVRE